MERRLIGKYIIPVVEIVIGAIFLIYCFVDNTFKERLYCAIVCFASALLWIISFLFEDKRANAKTIHLLANLNLLASATAILLLCIIFNNFDIELIIIDVILFLAGILGFFKIETPKPKENVVENNEEQD